MSAEPRSIQQRFHFQGATSDHLARVLAEAPLLGDGGIFGRRAGRDTGPGADSRNMIGFEPLPFPLIRFDVQLRQRRARDRVEVLVEFSQPKRRRPYLEGQFVWLLEDADGGAVLEEEINTPVARELVERPLHGRGRSVRRYLFFAGGHERLMKDVVANLRALLAS